MFYYVKNLQGDIVKILDEDGNEKASYVYNAWGNILSQSEDELSSINPLRYRGYVYDTDTGLYYLQSRYYDPTTGRFINADDTAYVDTNSGTPLNTNMFAYCENNFINNVDKTGHFFLVDDLAYLVVGALVITVAAVFLSSPAVRDALNNVVRVCGTKIKEACESLSDTIVNSIDRAKTKPKSQKNKSNHIVAKKAARAFNSRKLLQKANIGINSTYNLVYVKYRLRRCMHTNVYHDKVYRLLSKGKGERKKTIAILKYIKELLLAANKQIP